MSDIPNKAVLETSEIFTRLKQLEYIAKYLRMKCLREAIDNAEDIRNLFNDETNTLILTENKHIRLV
jgi:hypothetical protein